ncbi:MAG TPA: permease-like cell division protein FtsX [Coriobacteriia bacterium]|nr:permease-like cell division protein FtsX [Coriobacteriia bacterium]
MSINIGYFAKESWQNFRRNWVMSFGAVITIYLSLLLVGIFLVTGVLVNSIVQSVEDKVTIQVFLKDGAATEDVNTLQKQLLADPLVDTVDYTSKKEALDKFKQDMANSPDIIEQIEGNPLPASLDVALKDPRTVQQMVDKIIQNQVFLSVCDRPDNPEESLKYGQQIVNKLFAFTRVIRIIEIVFVAMLAVVSLIFINNTIRLAIYARRKEIGIMRLVGASNWFIRTPFLLEGIMQALIGAVLAILSLLALQAAILPRLAEAVPFLAVTLSGGAMGQISAALIIAGVFIGLLGSTLAMRRYLRV